LQGDGNCAATFAAYDGRLIVHSAGLIDVERAQDLITDGQWQGDFD
jgi:hypothetical protein